MRKTRRTTKTGVRKQAAKRVSRAPKKDLQAGLRKLRAELEELPGLFDTYLTKHRFGPIDERITMLSNRIGVVADNVAAIMARINSTQHSERDSGTRKSASGRLADEGPLRPLPGSYGSKS